jgi:RimJ/RimL family protein N-acetyltransferase
MQSADSEAVDDTLIESFPVRVRPLRESDVEMLTEWFSDPAVYRTWWGHEDDPYEPHEIEGWFHLDGYEPDRFVIVEDAGNPVAYWQWDMSGARPRTANLAGFVPRAAQGRGIGQQSMRLLTEYLMTAHRCYRVAAHPEDDNLPAVNACLRAGFAMYCRVVPEPANGHLQAYFPAERLHPPLITVPGRLRARMDWAVGLSPRVVPSDVRYLLPLAGRWAILDYIELREAISLTPLTELTALVNAVADAGESLTGWLDDIESFTTDPPSEYVALAAMTHAARSARAAIAGRTATATDT